MPLMHEALASVVKHLHLKESYRADSLWSAVHYKFVFAIMLLSCILSGFTTWYTPIHCSKVTANDISESLITQWCYAVSTFTVQGDFNSTITGITNSEGERDNVKVHITYYQWVTIVLLLQAVSFQVPHLLWKAIEGGRVKAIVDSLQHIQFMSAEERSDRIDKLAAYFHASRQLNDSILYYPAFAMCQIMYFANICLQISITNAFLNNNFLELFPRWLNHESLELDRVFPKVAKCIFRNFGTSGSEQKHDSICVLAMNVLIEKIYLVLWVVFAVTLVLSVLQMIWLLYSFVYSRLRRFGRIPLVLTSSDYILLQFLESSLDCLVYDELSSKINPQRDSQSLLDARFVGRR